MSSTKGPAESRFLPAMGVLPASRRERTKKLVWIAAWMIFLGGPVQDLAAGDHSPAGTVGGALGFTAFIAVYAGLILRHAGVPERVVSGAGAVLYGLAVVLSVTMGDLWLIFFVYATVCLAAVLPERPALWSVVVTALTIALIGTHGGRHVESDAWVSYVIPSVLAGVAVLSGRKTALTMRELRAARATVAHLAANEERLRLARDLHDLLGHSLSLITLKSELAGRMLPGQPERAASEVADIERVSRQALVDVREAVSGYRRPTLAAELAGARTALAAAGIAADVPQAEPDGTVAGVRLDSLETEAEGALAWALREAVTNVVRHSGATRCAVVLTLQADETACLTVTDNGGGPDGDGGAGVEGNGLTGLRERLALADGVLETAPGVRGGFTLRATVPVRARTHAQ